MIERYSLSPMTELWSEESKFRIWQEVELAVCAVWSEKGVISEKDLKIIQRRARFSVHRIDQIELKVRHDVIAFLTVLSENIGPPGRYLHLGMTSSDLVDTALAIRLVRTTNILLTDLNRLIEILISLAIRYRYTPMIGRTHGIHAEPISFGLKLGIWVNEMFRNRERLEFARETIRYGKISGAVGTYAFIPPDIEEKVCQRLGLKPAEISNQVLQRDRHAQYLTTLAILAGSMEKIATEIRHLQRTEVLELEEPFREGQKGSSAMPHKRNPVLSEQLCGLARIVRSNSIAGLENIALWHERDISHSSVERVILPDSTILVHYMLNQLIDILQNMTVYETRMKQNLELTNGLIYSQQILLALTQNGMSRENAYQLIQTHAMTVWRTNTSFYDILKEDNKIREYLTENELRQCFNPDNYLRNIDRIFNRQKWVKKKIKSNKLK